jgi:hypothetical protein
MGWRLCCALAKSAGVRFQYHRRDRTVLKRAQQPHAITENSEKQQMSNKLVRGRPFLPGESGNLNGRPKGSRTAFSAAFVSDLMVSWAEHGAKILDQVAKRDPVRFLGVAASVCPKDVSLSIQERGNPGNLSNEDWAILTEVMQAIKLAIPDAESRPPSEVLTLVRDAIQAHTARTIEGE